jgi:hypothetical protein
VCAYCIAGLRIPDSLIDISRPLLRCGAHRPAVAGADSGCGGGGPGASVEWEQDGVAEYYLQVVGKTATDVGPYTLSLFSYNNFAADKIDGTCV